MSFERAIPDNIESGKENDPDHILKLYAELVGIVIEKGADSAQQKRIREDLYDLKKSLEVNNLTDAKKHLADIRTENSKIANDISKKIEEYIPAMSESLQQKFISLLERLIIP